MSFLKKALKTVNPVAQAKAVVKSTKAVAKATKQAVSSPKAALSVALNPVAQTKLAFRTTKTLSQPLPTAVNPLKQAAAAGKFHEKVRTAATIMRLPSIAATMNVKKAIQDPKGYVKDIGAGYKGDFGFAGQFYGAVKSKNFKGIITQGSSDTAKALGALGVPKQVTEKIESKGTTLAAVLPPPKAPDPPPEATPTESQATGEPFIEGVTAPAPPLDVVEMGPEEAAAQPGGPPMLLILASAAVVLFLVTR